MCIQNGLEMNCTYWLDCRKLLNSSKKFILICLSITRFKLVQTDPYGKFGIKNNARVIRLANRVWVSDSGLGLGFGVRWVRMGT